MPRNTKFKSKHRETFLKLLKSGLPLEVACNKIGIDYPAYYDWKARADRYNPADESTRADKPYYRFFREIYRARAFAFEQFLEEIKQAGMGYHAAEPVERYRTGEEKTIGPKKVRNTAKSLPHPRMLTFLAERLFPTFFGSRMELDLEQIKQLLLREIDKYGSKNDPAPGRSTASSAGSREPEDWEKLPGESRDND